MTKQTGFALSLDGSRIGLETSRWRTLTTAVIIFLGGAIGSLGQQPQTTPAPANPTTPAPAKPPATETKPAPVPSEKRVGNYTMHSSVELGGVITTKSGSDAMWATMVNEGTGMRVLNQFLELHSVDPSKTPFFDRLTTASTGYGGEAIDTTYLNMSKGRIYDFAGNFRRDRFYYDYNLMPNPLLSTATATNPPLLPQPDSLHIFNTVRRNTDVLITFLPLSKVDFRVGYNHNTNEGPTFSSVHGAGDVQVSQWFRNAIDTYVAGVDYKLAKRTVLSYDQFIGLFRGDSPYQLAPTPFTLSNGTPTSLGVTTLAGTICGTGANASPEVVNGIANPYCNQTIVQSQTAPTRTVFPTEQFRFTSHYWDKAAFNGRLSYNSDVTNVNSFNETFNGLLTRTFQRQEIDTGGYPNGRLAHNKRINLDGDFGAEAELTPFLTVSDAVNYRNFRVEGNNILVSQSWAGTATTPNLNVFTPLSSLTPTTTTTPGGDSINQAITRNTLLGTVTVVPQFKFSAGWRFDNRHITDPGDDLTWHQNGLLIGAALTPSRAYRFNVNFDTLDWKSANSSTPSNTYTREANDKVYHVRVRGQLNPAKWINFGAAFNDFEGRNDDPLVNHREHNRDFSLGTQINPVEQLSLDFNYAYDDVFSVTDLCYIFVATATYPLPPGTQSSVGTCLQTTDNPGGTLPTQPASSQLNLGNGRYDAPVNFFSGTINWSPSKYFRAIGGARVTDTNGSAEFLNPLAVPGALQSKVISPFADLVVNIAPQWAWHGNWVHHGYDEAGGPGPASREFHGDVVTLGVRYAF